MKKITTFFAMAAMMVGAAYSQVTIRGIDFATNPAKWNGKPVTVKDIQLNMSNHQAVAAGAVAPAGTVAPGGALGGAPGPNGQGAAVIRCNPPRGFKQIDVDFIEKPDFEGCFFMSEAMYNELKKQTAGQTKVDVQLTFRGDNKMGYQVTFYRLGK